MTQALDTLLELAVRQRDTALLALQQADETCRRLALQTDQLMTYRDDYRRRSPVRDGRSAPIDVLRGHEGFMGRLGDALTQQQRTQQAAQGRAAALRTELMVLEQRVASVRKLQQRRAAEAEHVSARREQRSTDELAQQRAWRDRAEDAAHDL